MATRPRRRWPRSLRPWRHNGHQGRGAGGMTSDGLQHRLAVALEGGDHRGWLGRIIAWLMVTLIIINIVDVALDTVPDLYQHYRLWFAIVQVGSMAIFTLEFAARLWVAGAPAPDRP